MFSNLPLTGISQWSLKIVHLYKCNPLSIDEHCSQWQQNWNNIYCLSILLLHSVAATQAIQLTSPLAYNNSSAVKLLCPGSSSFYWLTHVLYFMLIVRTIFPHVWPWDFRKHLVREHVCADGAACHWLTWLLGLYRLHRFMCSAAVRLTGTGVGRDGEDGRMGELPIIWCRLSCIIPTKGGRNCWRRHRAQQLKTERESEATALSVGVAL